MADAMSPAIAAIEARLRADPDDWDSWRVYADHLLDRGDRHGELITLAALRQTRPGDRALGSTIAALDAELRAAWQVDALDDDRVSLTWRHGFPIALTHSIDQPRDIRALGRLLADPRMRLVARLLLSFTDNLRARFYAELAQLELGRLHTLTVGRTRRGDALARALAAMPSLRLDTLRLNDIRLTAKGVKALTCNASLRTLRVLELQRNRLGAAGLEALVDAPLLDNLEVLDLHYNFIDADMARVLAGAPCFAKLRTLGLHVHQVFDPEAIRVLAGSQTLPREITRYWQGILDQRTRAT